MALIKLFLIAALLIAATSARFGRFNTFDHLPRAIFEDLQTELQRRLQRLVIPETVVEDPTTQDLIIHAQQLQEYLDQRNNFF